MTRLKHITKEAIRMVLQGVARVMPKANIAVLRGPSAYEDNLIAIYRVLRLRPVRAIIWVVNDPRLKPPVSLGPEARLVKRGGWLDVYYSMRAKYLFLTYEHYLRKPPHGQISTNLWHGIPLKAIGKTAGQAGRTDTIMVSTSALTTRIFSDAFGMPQSACAVTGQARTDRMFELGKQALWERVFPGQPVPEKLFLWLPTFRTSIHDTALQNGRSFGNVFNCSDFSDKAFNTYLAEHNAFCLLKPHPAAPRQSLRNKSNLIYIDEDWLTQHQLTLYQLTGAVDCLISDISSILLDFMLLNRPIVLLFEDIEAYEQNRGFSLNPITDYLPATVTQDFSGFMQEIDRVLNGQDTYADRRARLRDLFFDYNDNGASERILDRVFER